MSGLDSNEIADIEAKADALRNVSTNTFMGVESIRCGMQSFVKPGYWRTFVSRGREWEFATFDDFCDKWMKFPRKSLENLFAQEPDVMGIIQVAVGKMPDVGAPAGNSNAATDKNKVYNVNLESEQESKGGNAASYTMRRLLRDREDLFDRVASGELSANAAAIAAGFREPTVSIRINPESAAKTIAGKFTNEQIAELIKRLSMTLEALEA